MIGLVLLVVGVGAACNLMLDNGNDLDWFNSPLIHGIERDRRSSHS